MTTGNYGSMVQEYYVARVRELTAQRAARLAAIKTRADALRYRAEVRRKLQRVFGPWPERTPLRPRIMGSFERPIYRVEHVVFESRPRYHITANLYIPKGKGPFPCAVATCGHTENGKAAGTYQRFARTLAEKGFLVLHFDPSSQGERHQYGCLPKNVRITTCVREHLMSGKQLSLVGEFLGTWHAWDGMRALDYLLSRPEADRTRVGVTGNSGGGTFSTYMSALDDRYTMAAPSCFITTYLNDLENELPADSEQIPPGIIGLGLEHADFFIAQAPRPVIILGQHNCFFDERGIMRTYEEVRRIYSLLGAKDAVAVHIGPGTHGYQTDARLAMYRFFNKHAGVRVSGRESTRPDETESTLRVSPRGNVANLPGNRFTFDIARDLGKSWAKRRGQVSGKKLTAAITSVLNLPRRSGISHYRTLRPTLSIREMIRTLPVQKMGGSPSAFRNKSKAYNWSWVFGVETEPGIMAILFQWERQTVNSTGFRSHPLVAKDITLYVPHTSSENDVVAGEVPITPSMFFTVDPRGIGRTMSRTGYHETDFLHTQGGDYFHACHGMMLCESLLGRRVHDVLATLDLLVSCGAKRVHLVGRGLGSIVATFAACLHPAVNRVTLRQALRSYHELTQTTAFAWPQSSIPFGVLQKLDLPDCHRALKKKQLRFIGRWEELSDLRWDPFREY